MRCYEDERCEIWIGDCRAELAAMAEESAQVCVTSPPYWGLRDYGHGKQQLGLEKTPEAYVVAIVEVFEAVRRVLRKDGTLWLNLGDCYQAGDRGLYTKNRVTSGSTLQAGHPASEVTAAPNRLPVPGLKRKDLVGVPWRVALALQAAGWYLRAEIIWYKPDAMPESVGDRPTTAHERVFLLSKSERYFYDADAIAEPVNGTAHSRGNGVNPKAKLPSGWNTDPDRRHDGVPEGRYGPRRRQNESISGPVVEKRNKRSVWTIPTQPTGEAHFATFPEDLVKPCVLAGSREGDVVLDPFLGSGTTLRVAKDLQRRGVGIEIQPAYVKLAIRRLQQEVLVW